MDDCCRNRDARNRELVGKTADAPDRNRRPEHGDDSEPFRRPEMDDSPAGCAEASPEMDRNRRRLGESQGP